MIRPLSSRIPLTLLAVLVLFGLLYTMWPPLVLSSSTWLAFAALLFGIAIVTFNTANNAPAGSFGQLLYETENPRARAADPRKTRPASRW